MPAIPVSLRGTSARPERRGTAEKSRFFVRSISTTSWSRPPPSPRVAAEKPNERKYHEYYNPEEHEENYRRKDFTNEHFSTARLAWLDELARGEAKLDLAKLALLVAAEDDALTSHSSVAFPVDAYLKRLEGLAKDFEVVLELHDMKDADDTDKVDFLLEFLFGDSIANTSRFTTFQSRFERGDLKNTVVDAPGVYESPHPAYLNSVLTRKRGLSASLAVIVSDVLRRLTKRGVLNHWVKVVPSAGSADGIPLVELMIRGEGSNIDMNSCSLEAMRMINIHLKRAFWPFRWSSNDPVSGGFLGAAKTFLDGASSAESEAIARAALHRLQRGVWTSPGAGDIRRALAACERLVLLTSGTGTSKRHEASARRDYAILLLHVGRFEEAKKELLRYKELVDIEGNLEYAVYSDKLIHRLREVDLKSEGVFGVEAARHHAQVRLY